MSILVIFLAIANIVVNATKSEWAQDASNRIRVGLDLIGHPRFIYTPLILFSIFFFHAESWIEAVVICMVTGATVWWSLGDFLVGGFYRIKRAFVNKTIKSIAGEVVAFQDPGIVLIRQQYDGDIRQNSLLYISDKHGPKKLVVALGYVGRSEGILVRAVELQALSQASQAIVGDAPFDEVAYHLEDRALDEICEREGIKKEAQANIVGLVAPDTSIDHLFFEIIDNTELEEGRLVSAAVDKATVMYQIVAGLTKEEIVQQKNTYGYLRGQAQQIGIWDATREKFRQCNWLPTINTPVYEEAHSLVPEWNSVVNDSDKNATSGTARAILQGRKYGLGCLLITQRTANVTKTILNQCNTVFAMRTFDATGKEFLGNYIGRDYSDSLSSIPERHAVFFGKASSCENPVLIRLNDRDEFRTAFRAAHPPPPLPVRNTKKAAPVAAEPAEPEEFDDDIPF